MNRRIIVIVLLAVVLVCQSVPAFVLKNELPKQWLEAGPAPPQTDVSLTLVLNTRNAEMLERMFWEVSDPSHEQYTNYLTSDEVKTLFGVADEDVARIVAVLNDHSAKNIVVTPINDFITFDISVTNAERLLKARLSSFVHAQHGASIIRTLDEFTLPSPLEEHVSFITGLHGFPVITEAPRLATNYRKRQFGATVDPPFAWTAFSMDPTLVSTTKLNLQCSAQFLGQYYAPSDLASFQQTYNVKSNPVEKVIGFNDPTNVGDEACLDTEWISVTGQGIRTWFWSTAGLYIGEERFVKWATDMENSPVIPFVTSISYGDPEANYSPDYINRLDFQLQKMALRGVSILFASGDNGVGCNSNGNLAPNWPASSPYITAVGGFVANGPANYYADTISSGGFSNYYAQPKWQSSQVASFLSNSQGNLPVGFNASGRAFPDVSAFSENVITICSGMSQPIGGTSCAAPTFSGVISMINDVLLSKGLKPLGFLNQALYSISPAAFIDITTGSNPQGSCNGFSAIAGWDPITGLGGPNYPVLLAELRSLQEKRSVD